MFVLSLAACGKQDTDDGVKKSDNSMNDTTEAVGESTQSGLKAGLRRKNGKSVKKKFRYSHSIGQTVPTRRSGYTITRQECSISITMG